MRTSKIKIVAELAQGFEGCVTQATLLLKAAAKAGATSAKFQLVYADELATPDYKFYDLFRSLEMSDESWRELAVCATNLGIGLEFDIFGTKSLSLAESIGVQSIKLHGTDICNLKLVRQVAKSSVTQVYLGAGGSHLPEIEAVVNILSNKDIVIFLGFQGYPTALEDNQISRIELLKRKFPYDNVKIGFADHSQTEGSLRYGLSALALGCGALVFEKHLTLGKCMQLEDFEAALNPDEFAEFSILMRDLELGLGNSLDTTDFGMSVSEAVYRQNVRRDVVLTASLRAGSVLTPENLCLKRTPSVGALRDLALACNKRLLQDVNQNCALLPHHVQL